MTRLIRLIGLLILVGIALQRGDWPLSRQLSAVSYSRDFTRELQRQPRSEDRLSPSAFANPPIEARLGCYWAWLNGSITEEQITRDLEAMA